TPRGPLAGRGRRRPTRRLHAGPPTTRPQVPPGVVRGSGRGRVQGGQPPLADPRALRLVPPRPAHRGDQRPGTRRAGQQVLRQGHRRGRGAVGQGTPGGAQAGRDHLLTWTGSVRAPRPGAPAVRTAGAEFIPTGGWPGTDPVGGWSRGSIWVGRGRRSAYRLRRV